MRRREQARRLIELAEAARAKGATMRSALAQRAMLTISNRYASLARKLDALADRCAKREKKPR
jgi:hypothetical protein